METGVRSGKSKGAHLILWISNQLTSVPPKNHERGKNGKVLEGHHESYSCLWEYRTERGKEPITDGKLLESKAAVGVKPICDV